MKNKIWYFKNKNYSITFKKISYEINNISPIIEIKRYELINEIKDEIRIIFNKNNLSIDVNNILPRFIMNQYQNSNYFVDPLLPYNATYFDQLKEDLYFLSDKTINKINILKLIKELDLKNKFNKAIDKLKLFINNHININSDKVDYKINETHDYVFNYFNLIIEDKKYLNFIKKFNLTQLKINKKLYHKLKNNYIIKSNNSFFFKTLVICLIIRYNTLESYNQQLAINPFFKEYLHKKFNIDFELFASSINVYYKNYCSLFYDLEKYFNSKGYFDNIQIKRGFFVANPPFDNQIMANMSLSFVNFLKNSQEPISILITIPQWDNKNYGGFESLNILKESNFIVFQKIIPKNKARFYDYYYDKFVYPVSIFIIILQNKEGKKVYPIHEDFKKNIDNYFNSSKIIINN